MAKYRILRTWPSKHNFRRGQIVEDPPLRNLGSLVRQKYLEEIGGKPIPEDRPKKVVEAEKTIAEKRDRQAADRQAKKPKEKSDGKVNKK